MKRLNLLLLSSLATVMLAVTPATAEAPVNTRMQVEEIVKDFIMKHPEVMIDSVQKYNERMEMERVRKASEALGDSQKELFEDANAPVAGNPKGDVAMVEFFDYHCGFCKHSLPAVSKLIQEDPNLKVIFKEFPILSQDSELASRAALAVYRIDKSKYFAFHSALMNATGSAFDPKSLSDTAKKLGIDPVKMEAEMQKQEVKDILDANRKLAEKIGVSGTPAFIIGNDINPGAASYETLKSMIANARAKAKMKK